MKIHGAEYIISAPGLKHCPDFGGLPEIVLVGRSNVGKSSFINSLTSRKNLARTSNTPGKTRHINFYKIQYSDPSAATVRLRDMLFVDLPGYGYAKVSKTEQAHWRRELEGYLSKRESIRQVVQLIDARHGALDSDIQMFEWLQYQGKPVWVVLTKTDKVGTKELSKSKTETARALDLVPDQLLTYSSEKHQGRDVLWRKIDALLAADRPEASLAD
jgi:GTP-binding protein